MRCASRRGLMLLPAYIRAFGDVPSFAVCGMASARREMNDGRQRLTPKLERR